MKDKTVVIGITGGIACYKIAELVSALKKHGANVSVIMTKNATEFIAPLTFETLSSNPVVTDMFNRDFSWEVGHIALAKRADIFVVAPATANFVGKFACGIADDFLTTTAMAVTCPILIAPAMNTNMYNSPAYQANESILASRGVNIISPDDGHLACGDVGKGRMAEPSQILAKIEELLSPKLDFAGKTVLVTAGATSEPIDPVRYITNRSSGKMGIAIANAVVRRGGKVILITGKTTAKYDNNCERIEVGSTSEMFDSVMANYERADIIIKAAAPSDYKATNVFDSKQKGDTLTLTLVKNPDIASSVGKVKGNRKLIIFCAETEDLLANADKKLRSKNADMIVANDVTKEGAGFDVDTNIVSILTREKRYDYDKMTKVNLADVILDRIQEL